MARTTQALVEKVIEIDDGVDLTGPITIANILVTNVCAPLGYDAATLEAIERFLAAHFHCLNDPKLTREKIGAVDSTFETDKVDLGLNLTRYGSNAMVLDHLGGLSAANDNVQPGSGPTTVGVLWAGTDYDDIEELGLEAD